MPSGPSVPRTSDSSQDDNPSSPLIKASKGARTGAWRRRSTFAQWGSALLYGTVAVAMNFLNRWALLYYPLPAVILLLQMIATLLILQPLHWAGVLLYAPFSWRRCRQLMGISVLYTGNTAFALYGLKTLNVPMYSTLKRLTPMMVLVAKAVMRGSMPPTSTSLSVLLVVAGCVVAGLGDLTFDPLGYTYALLSCTTQSGYLLLVELQGGAGASTSELLYYNAITSIPMMLLIMATNGDMMSALPKLAAASTQYGFSKVVVMLLSCSIMGCGLNYSLFLCTMHNSALTTTVVGVLKGVVAVLLGFVIDTVKVSGLNLLGVGMNTAGGVWYTVIKYRQKQRQQQGLVKHVLASASVEPLNLLASSSGVSLKQLLTVKGWWGRGLVPHRTPAATAVGAAALAPAGNPRGNNSEAPSIVYLRVNSLTALRAEPALSGVRHDAIGSLGRLLSSGSQTPMLQPSSLTSAATAGLQLQQQQWQQQQEQQHWQEEEEEQQQQQWQQQQEQQQEEELLLPPSSHHASWQQQQAHQRRTAASPQPGAAANNTLVS